MDSAPRESLSLDLADAEATETLGGRIAEALRGRSGHWFVTLQGGLGAGKTTLVRGILRGLGHRGRVPSPTYTLIEPYRAADRAIFHVDLYRLADPEELEYLGFRELFRGDAIVLVEWPERAGGDLPAPDLQISLDITGVGRAATIRAASERARGLLAELSGNAG
jgi:tRNA threonylcarbamoyladenosine biosynthesis protein TsaE